MLQARLARAEKILLLLLVEVDVGLVAESKGAAAERGLQAGLKKGCWAAAGERSLLPPPFPVVAVAAVGAVGVLSVLPVAAAAVAVAAAAVVVAGLHAAVSAAVAVAVVAVPGPHQEGWGGDLL